MPGLEMERELLLSGSDKDIVKEPKRWPQTQGSELRRTKHFTQALQDTYTEED